MWAMSSGAGAGNARAGLSCQRRGSLTSMTGRSHPSSRSANPAVVTAAIGAASSIMNSDPGRRQRRVDRQIGRPGLEHRQNRHDRLSATGKTAAPHTAPGPHPDRPTGAPTGSTPPQARGRSTNAPRTPAPPPPGRGPPARRTTPESTPACSPAAVNTARLPHLIQPGVLTGIQHIHRRQPPCRVGGHRHQHPLQPPR